MITALTTIQEGPKVDAIDAKLLLDRLQFIKIDYTVQQKPRARNSYARGAVETIDEIIEIVKGMPKYEI